MKNIYKIITVLLAISLIVCCAVIIASANISDDLGTFTEQRPEKITANVGAALSGYTYVAYESEASFRLDIDENNTIDGLDASGNSLLIEGYCGTTNVITLPAGGQTNKSHYIYLLSDVSTPADTKIVMTEVGQRLFINLGGKKLTISSGSQINTGGSSYVKKTNCLAIFNGTLESKVTSGQALTPRQNSTLFLCDLEINLAGVSLMQDGGANIYFENLVVNGSNATFVYLRQSWQDNACTCDTVTCSCPDEKQLHNKHVYKNVTVNTKNGFGLDPGQTVRLDMYFDKDCRFATTGSFFSNPSASGTIALPRSEFYMHFEEGVVFSSSYANTNALVTSRIKGYDSNGEPFGKIVKEDTVVDGVTYSYVVKSAPYKVTWVDYNGDVLSIDPYFDGETPIYQVSRPGTVSVKDDGLPYIFTFAGWGLTEEATDPVDELPVVSGDVTYYLVMEDKLANFAVYESEQVYKDGGAPINAWADDGEFNKKLFQSFPANSYMVLFADMEYNQNARIEDFADGITIDLNGKTFRKTGEEGQCRFITPAGKDETLTIKNGKVYSYKQNLVYSSHTSGVEGLGEIIFENCEIELESGAMDIRSGTVTFKGCTIKSNANVATIGNASSDYDMAVNFYGTSVEAKNYVFMVAHPKRPDKSAASRPTINVDSYDEDGKFWARPTISSTGTFCTVSSGTASIDINSYLTININNAFISNTTDLVKFNTPLTIYDPDAGSANGAYTAKDYKGVYTIKNSYIKTLNAADCPGKLVYGEGMILLSVYDDPDMPYYIGEYVNGMKANLSLSTDFTLNLYIPVDTRIDTVEIDGYAYFEADYAEDDFDVVDVHGVPCYYIPLDKVTPQNAAEKLTFTVYFENDDGIGVCYSMLYSVTEYAKGVLEKPDSQLGTVAKESKALMANTLAYVAAAYAQFNADATESIAYLEELCTKYPATVTVPEADDTAIGADLAALVTGASFKLDNKIVLKLTLAASDTPVTVTVNGTEYDTVPVAGENAVYVYLNAKDIAGVITITSGEASGTYSLAAYYNSDEIQGASNEIKSVVEAMYAYGKSAAKLSAKTK